MSFTIFFLSLFLSLFARAQVDFEDGVFPEIVPSSRALAMGNAFVARVDDESAPFYNPAGLGSVRGWNFHLSNFLLEFSKDFSREVTTDMSNTFKYMADSFDLDGLRKVHQNSPGHSANTRFSMMPNLTTRFLSFGLFYVRHIKTFYGGRDGDRFEFADRTDSGPYIGANFSLWGGIFKGGLSLIRLKRYEVRGDADMGSSFTPASSQRSKGTMRLYIAGARIILPFKTLPTLSATLHNVEDEEFTAAHNGWQAPQSIVPNLAVGVSITPYVGRGKKLHIEINHKDLEKNREMENSARWMAGMELNFSKALFLRAGYRNNFISGGIGVRTKTFHFDLSSYAKGKHSERFPKTEDRGLVFSSSFRL
ncbi:MAG: hypothetical protein OXB88_00620 [Bacteriovoracales bacterium]|nr:hypothetical protein [Bacteriovoracales bacterium]